MKKTLTFFVAIATISLFASCNKEQPTLQPVDNTEEPTTTVEEPEANRVTINVTTDQTDEHDTKVQIVETSSSAYSLNWDGSEAFGMGCTTSDNYVKTSPNWFTIQSHTGSSAVFSGVLPDAGTGSTQYMAAFNFYSVATGVIRAKIPDTQNYAASGVLANSALLVAKSASTTVGTLTSLSFTPMNAFLGFKFKKGNTAAGSSNVYTSHMYVQSVKVETIADGEALAGTFSISRTSASWQDAYNSVQESISAVTLNCVTATYTNGVDLSTSTDTDFYVAIAFGDFSKGLRVTVTVKDDNGKYGTYVRTISNGSNYSVARKKLISFPSLTVNPEDRADEVTLWSEDWTGGEADATISEYVSGGSAGTTVYGGGSVTYSNLSDNTKIYATGTLAGGDGPELLLYGKKNPKDTWTVSGIPTAGKKSLTLTWKSNNTNCTANCTTSGVSITGSSKNYTLSFDDEENIPATITLTFSASANTRIDDIVLKGQ